ncbi:hypothetical protein NC653_008379 [Populus alba x Populus x berolinensis]|uniref:Uncharacterized protein n=1 Tax=Populus alba x Populus x berolinensis TaxID=444605 RepID=A0AAD6R664_9ROSI|nr:hypothetical protein NC653_008379 [Populus alba x Populus x berolinensis]
MIYHIYISTYYAITLSSTKIIFVPVHQSVVKTLIRGAQWKEEAGTPILRLVLRDIEVSGKENGGRGCPKSGSLVRKQEFGLEVMRSLKWLPSHMMWQHCT